MEEKSQNIPAKLLDLDTIWNPADPARAEAAFRALLPAALELDEKNRFLLVELLTQIARAEGAQSKIPEARKTLDEAEKILNTEGAAYRVSAKIRWLLEQGRLFIAEKTPSRARVLFSQAWTLAVNSGEDYHTIDIAHMMAMIEPQKLQQEWILKAIQIAEDSPQANAKRWLGSLYASLGWKLFDLRQHEKALETFQKSLSYFKAKGTDREVFVAQWSIGKLLRKMNRTEEALTLQKSLLSELGISGATDGRLYEEIAECLHTLNKTADAQLYFELAHKELSSEQWVSDNQPLKLKRLKDLGKVRNKPV